MADEIPAFPQSAYRILQLASDLNYSHKALVRIVEHDPVLTLRMLKLVNAPYFGLSHKVSSIKQAVVFIGMNTLKNLALTISPLEALSDGTLPSKPSGPLLTALQLHATTTAVFARRLARRMGVTEVEVADYFVAGMLHDFGIVVFSCCMPERFKEVLQRSAQEKTSFMAMEKEVFGLDHAELGAYMGEKWHLPAELIACMRDHHVRDVLHPTLLHDCVYTANLLAGRLASSYFGRVGQQKELPDSIARHFGTTKVTELLQVLGDVSEEIGKTRVLFQ